MESWFYHATKKSILNLLLSKNKFNSETKYILKGHDTKTFTYLILVFYALTQMMEFPWKYEDIYLKQ